MQLLGCIFVAQEHEQIRHIHRIESATCLHQNRSVLYSHINRGKSNKKWKVWLVRITNPIHMIIQPTTVLWLWMQMQSPQKPRLQIPLTMLQASKIHSSLTTIRCQRILHQIALPILQAVAPATGQHSRWYGRLWHGCRQILCPHDQWWNGYDQCRRRWNRQQRLFLYEWRYCICGRSGKQWQQCIGLQYLRIHYWRLFPFNRVFQHGTEFRLGSIQCSYILTPSSNISGTTTVTLTDNDENVLLSHETTKSYNSIIVSCPELTIGSTYTLTAGDTSQSITLTSTVN